MKYHILDRNSLSCSSKVWPSLKQHHQGHQFLMGSGQPAAKWEFSKARRLPEGSWGRFTKEILCAQSCRWGLQRPQSHMEALLTSRQSSSSATGFSHAFLLQVYLPCRTPSVPQIATTWVQDLGKHRSSTKLPQGFLSNTPGTSCPEGLDARRGLPKKA